MRAPLPLLIAGLVVSLAACGPREEAEAPTPAATDAAPAAEAAEAAEAAPAAEATPTPAAVVTAPDGQAYPEAQAACLDAVAAQTNLDRATLTVTEVLWAEAGVGVTITVPGADAPWSCLADEAGNVQGAAYTGSEGAL